MAETARSMRADWHGRARDDDGAARQTSSTAVGRGSTMRPGGKRSATEDGLGCGGGETSSTAGRGWVTEARSKMAMVAARIDV